MHIIFKCADAVYQKLSKLVHACRKYSLPKLAHFLRHSVVAKDVVCIFQFVLYFTVTLYDMTCCLIAL